jgi:hypothetical protein
MTADFFRMSKSAVWESYHRFEEREYAIASAQVISKLFQPPNSLLLLEEKNVMTWMNEWEVHGKCPSRVKCGTLQAIYLNEELVKNRCPHSTGGADFRKAKVRSCY